ncbi:MAG: radical SAM protein [Planctomycetes bacterium]|nr:radical SAM protein [Planctomycetota bacterium]
MTHRVRPYQYYDVAISICSTCLRKVEGKIYFDEGGVWLDKRCPEHGREQVLIADDVDYYRRSREVFIKPSEMPQRFNTPIKHGCPYDCGLCPDHEQHSCLTLVELGDHCNLACPVCYAESGPDRPLFHDYDRVVAMLDAVVANEGEPDVVQLSGGEPTLHPCFFDILDAAKARPIKHLMVNTNGIRIAKDADFARRLAGYMPAFEIYLQFDSFEKEALMELRGADLREVRREAVRRLNELGISTTLVVTLKKGLNDHEIGSIIDWAVEQPCIRGVTLQPIQDAGRNAGYEKGRDRLTLSEVRRKILEQTTLFRPEDVIPVPCHPDALAMAYALKQGRKVTPLTGMIDPKVLIEGGRNTIVFERDESLKGKLFEAFSTAHSPRSGIDSLKSLLCCLPKLALPGRLSYENLFRVIIMHFMDAHDFDVRSVKKSCVHIVHPEDLRIIPFETYNLFYRGDLEERVLRPLRAGRIVTMDSSD